MDYFPGEMELKLAFAQLKKVHSEMERLEEALVCIRDGKTTRPEVFAKLVLQGHSAKEARKEDLKDWIANRERAPIRTTPMIEP